MRGVSTRQDTSLSLSLGRLFATQSGILESKVRASAARYHVCGDREQVILNKRPSQEELDAVALSGEDLSGVVLRELSLAGRDLRGTKFRDAVLNGVNFSNSQLQEADFTGAEIDGCTFEGCQLEGACLEAVRGEEVDFSGANLTGANLKSADLGTLTVNEAVIHQANLERSRWLQVRGKGLKASSVQASGWILDEASLPDADFQDAVLTRAVFQFVEAPSGSFARANFGSAQLVKPNFDGADLEGIAARDAHLRGVALDSRVAEQFAAAGARVGSRFAQWRAKRAGDAEQSDGGGRSTMLLRGAGVSLIAASFFLGGAKVGAAMVPTVGAGAALWRYRSQRGLRAQRREDIEKLAPGADLRGAQLRGAKLAGRDLRGIDLRNASLQGADLEGANLEGAKLDGARLDRCRLVRARLHGSSLKDAVLDDVRATEVVLSSADATSSRWVGADLRGGVFDNAILREADLSAARLSQVNFSNADLSFAVLEQTDLVGAKLAEATVEGLEAEGALGLSGAEMAALESRGARVNALSLHWLRWFTEKDKRAPRIARVVVLVLLLGMGGFLVTQYIGPGNLSDEEMEGRALEDVSRGDLEAAIERYEALFERSEVTSEQLVFLYEMAALMSEAERYGEAVVYLRRAEGLSEDAVDQGEVSLRLAEALGASGDIDGQVAALEAMVQRDDLSTDLTAKALVQLSEATAAMGFPERALSIHEDVLNRFGSNPTVVLRVNRSMAELLASRGRYSEALEAVARISDFPLEDRQRAELMVLEASLYEQQGLQVKSLEIYKELKRRYPEYRDMSGQALLSMARLTARQGQAEEATGLLEELLGRGADASVLARANLLRGQVAEEQGNLDAATLAYRAVLSLEGVDQDAVEAARVALANALLRSGSADADSVLEEMVSSGDPELAAQALLGNAQVALEIGDTEEARGIAERVVTEFKDVPDAEESAKTLLAQILVAEARYPEAVRAYRSLLEAARNSDERVVLQASISDALLQGGRVREAEAGFASMLETDGDHPEAGPLARLGLARVAETLGDHEKARLLYGDVVENAADPALRAAALERLALAYLDAGRDQDAMVFYQRFLDTLPDGHDAAFGARLDMAGILVRRGDNDQAKTLYERLLLQANTPARRAEVEFALGELRESAGDLPGALQSYSAIRSRLTLPLERRVEAGLGLGRVQLALGDPAAALETATETEAIARSESLQVSLLQLRIHALQELGREAEAEALSARLMNVAGDDEDARMVAQLELAQTRTNNGEFEEAIALYRELEESVTDRPTQAAMVLSVAQVQAQSGRLGEATATYQQVLENFGDLADTRFEVEMGLAQLDRSQGRLEQAAQRYAELEAQDVGSEVWRLEQLAQVQWEQDNAAAARETYEEIQDRFPGHPAALTASKNGLANVARAAGDLELARGLFAQVADQATDVSQREWAKLNAASILAEQGRHDDAFFALREVVASTTDPEVLLQSKMGMAAVYQEKGEFEKALELLNDADTGGLGPAWAASLTQARVASELGLGRTEEARSLWNQLLSEFGAHEEAKAQATLGIADIALQEGKPEEAIELFQKVASSEADRFFQAQAGVGWGRSLLAAGDSSRAADQFEAVIRDFEDHPEFTEIARSALKGL